MKSRYWSSVAAAALFFVAFSAMPPGAGALPGFQQSPGQLRLVRYQP